MKRRGYSRRSHVFLPPPPSAQVQPKRGAGDPAVHQARRQGKDAPLTSPPLETAATRALTFAAAAAPARSRPPAPQVSGYPSFGVSQARPARATPDPPGASLAPWWCTDPSLRRLHPLPPCACSSTRLGTRPRPASPPEPCLPVSPGPAGAGWSRGCDALPGSLSALDSTVAMAEAPVRVRAPASCREV